MARDDKDVSTRGANKKGRSRQESRDASGAKGKGDGREGEGSSAKSRAKERKQRVRPLGQSKSQTGAQKERKGGFLVFVRESYGELRKVDWPGQKQLVSATIAVLLAVFVVGFYLYVVDEVLQRFVRDVLLAG